MIVWSCETLQALLLLTGPKQGVKCVRFSPDGAFLACVSEDQILYIWDMQVSQATDEKKERNLESRMANVFLILILPDRRESNCFANCTPIR